MKASAFVNQNLAFKAFLKHHLPKEVPMLATCSSCGFETSMGVGSTVLICPRCKTRAPAAELHFEEEDAVLSDFRPPPERRRRRFTISPTARAFLLVIAVVAVMSWLVRLLGVAARPAGKQQRPAMAVSNALSEATAKTVRNVPEIHALAERAFAEIEGYAAQIDPNAENDRLSAGHRASIDFTAAINLSINSMERLIKANATSTPIACPDPSSLALASAEQASEPIAIMIAQAMRLSSMSVCLLQSLDEEARFESVSAETMAAIARTTTADWRGFAQTMEYAAEALVAAAQLSDASADEMRVLRAAIQTSTELQGRERVIKAMELAARAATLLAAAKLETASPSDMYAEIKHTLERISESASYPLERLALEAAVLYSSLKIMEECCL